MVVKYTLATVIRTVLITLAANILFYNIKSLKIIYMEFPCCSHLVHVAREALRKSGKNIPLEAVMIGIRGEKVHRTE